MTKLLSLGGLLAAVLLSALSACGGGGGVVAGGGTADTYAQVAALAGSSQGTQISGPLTQDAAGNLYGLTNQGGPNNFGTVFKVSTTGVVSTLYSFTNGADSQSPGGRIFLDASGNIYGHTAATVFRLTQAGVMTPVAVGSSISPLSDAFTCDSSMTWCYFWGAYGTVYKFSVSNGTFSAFTSLPSTSVPYIWEMQFGPDGNIYATDIDAVYKINVATPGYSVLHSFPSSASAGGWAVTRGLAFDSSGNIYGTTSNGGTNNNGVIFKLTSAGVASKLFDFPASSSRINGIQPQNGVVRDSAGNFYGMSLGGANLAGVLYKLDSAGVYSAIHTFTLAQTGTYPIWPLTYTSSTGTFYGVGPTGGSSSQGLMFKFN